MGETAHKWVVWVYCDGSDDDDNGRFLMDEISERDGVIQIDYEGSESY